MMKSVLSAWLFLTLVLAVHADDKPAGSNDSAGSDNNIAAPDLRTELLRRTGPDQEVRLAIMRWEKENGIQDNADLTRLTDKQKAEFEELGAKAEEVDKANTAWLKGVIEKHGWPTVALVGTNGAHAAWLLVQHADRDRPFQRHCLNLMAALPKGAISQSDFAYLTDRVLLAEDKKQLYGTQFELIDGKLKPRPLEDEPNVDNRRAAVGLQPLAEYLALAEQHILGKPAAK
jgi:hypothetical protein